MITVKCAGLSNARLVRNHLKDFKPDSYRFYSEFNGPIMLYILRKGCFLVMEDKRLLAIIFTNPASHHVYYIPTASKPLSFMAASFFIKKCTPSKGYTLKLTYSSVSFKAASSYLNVKPVTNLKHMSCLISSLSLQSTVLPQGVIIQPMKKGEESIRAELQNSIFGGIKNRIPLTAEEIKDEEQLSEYIGSMCYILRLDGKPSGYGQIMISNGTYTLINFGIIPQCRRQGLADVLLRYILYQCQSCGIESLHLTVDNNNPPAIALYKKNGFTELYNTAELII